MNQVLVLHCFGTREGLFRVALEMLIDPEMLVAGIVAGGPRGGTAAACRGVPAGTDAPETGPMMVSILGRVVAGQEPAGLIRDFIGAALLRGASDGFLVGIDHAEGGARIALVVSQMLAWSCCARCCSSSRSRTCRQPR